MNLDKMRAKYEAVERERAGREAAAAEKYADVDDGLLGYIGERADAKMKRAGVVAALVALTVFIAVGPLLAFYMFYSPALFGGTLFGLAVCVFAAGIGLNVYIDRAGDERDDVVAELERRRSLPSGEPPAPTDVPEGDDGLTAQEYEAISSLRYDVVDARIAYVSDSGSRWRYPVTSREGKVVLREAMERTGCLDIGDERVSFLAQRIEDELVEGSYWQGAPSVAEGVPDGDPR